MHFTNEVIQFCGVDRGGVVGLKFDPKSKKVRLFGGKKNHAEKGQVFW